PAAREACRGPQGGIRLAEPTHPGRPKPFTCRYAAAGHQRYRRKARTLEHDANGKKGKAGMQNPLILVIDDSLTARKMVEFHLTQAGYRVISAPDADRGLELARTANPELILLDHQLPGSTGDELCRRLLQGDATARIPVVISSAMRNRAFASYTDFP